MNIAPWVRRRCSTADPRLMGTRRKGGGGWQQGKKALSKTVMTAPADHALSRSGCAGLHRSREIDHFVVEDHHLVLVAPGGRTPTESVKRPQAVIRPAGAGPMNTYRRGLPWITVA